MQVAGLRGGGERPPWFLGETDAVFAGDDSFPRKHLTKKIVECGAGAGGGAGLTLIDHHVDVDVAVAGVTEAGDWQAVLALQAFGKFKEVLKAAAWHDNVLIEFGQAGVAK